MPTHIAIDGYSSCGKSTLAKALAKQLGFTYVDTGAMYRAVTLYFLKSNINPNNQNAIKSALKTINIELHGSKVFLNGEDVSDEIRKMPVVKMVSKVSAIKEIRQALVHQQQEMGKTTDLVMDGRDIGTTVFPNAKLKLFMTADPTVRAARRHLELSLKGEQHTLDEIYESLKERDLLDTTRTESPLKQAVDAIILDNSHLSPTEQLNFALSKLKERQ